MTGVEIAALVIAAAGAGYSGYQASEQADDAKEAAELQLQLQQDAIDTQNEQLSAQVAEEMSDNARQARREAAALRVAAGEAGVGGVSLQSLLSDVSAQTGFENSRTQRNLDNQIEKNSLDLQGFQLNSATKVQTAEARRTDALVGTGLQIAGLGVQGLEAYNKSKAAK